MDMLNQKTAAVNIKSENPTLLSPAGSGILGNSAGPSTGSVGIGQVPAPQPQTVQHHPPAPPYNPALSSQVQGIMSPPVNPPAAPATSQSGAASTTLVSSGPTSPIDGATSTTQVQIGSNGNAASQCATQPQPVSGQSTSNYYNNESGGIYLKYNTFCYTLQIPNITFRIFSISGNCSQYSSGLDYNGMSMGSASTQSTTSTEGNLTNPSGYNNWNGSGNNTVSYTQNTPSSSSGTELANHPGYSKSNVDSNF